MNREDLFKQFSAARRKGWSVAREDFPEDISDSFFPEKENLFRALEQFSPREVKYLILGQDPYPSTHGNEEPHATGIAFAVSSNCNDIPKSLRRIMNAIYGEGNGTPDLCDWINANNILLLNSALTVPQLRPNQNVRKVAGRHLREWSKFIRKVICQLMAENNDVVLIAWGCKPKRTMEAILGDESKFTWAHHPMASKDKNDPDSFKSFWLEPKIGGKLVMPC